MNFETAQKFIDLLLNNKISTFNLEETAGILFNFIGGEPLMEIELIDKITTYIVENMANMNHPWLRFCLFSLDSNGLLYFQPKVKEYFDKFHLMSAIGITVDGNKELHDKCRIDLTGQGSYDRVIKAVKTHQERYGKIPETKMTLSPKNIMYTKNAVINLINLGYTDIFFNCQFEPVWSTSDATILFKQLIDLANYVIDNELYSKIYISMFEENHGQEYLPGDNEQNYCGGTTDNMLALNYKGEIYTCIRYMESSLNGKQKPLIIGDIDQGYLSTEEYQNNHKILENITRRSQSTDECYYCPIASGCSWCSAYNYEINGTPNKRLTYTCLMHKTRILANVYYWNKLYQKLNIDKIYPNNVSQQDIDLIINKEDNYNEYKFISQFKTNPIKHEYSK